MKKSLGKLLHAAQRTSLAPAVNWPLAIGAFAAGTIGGLRNYFQTGHVSRQNWDRILKAHCLTNGRSTTWLNLVTRLVRPPRSQSDVSGMVGSLTVAQQNKVVEALNRDGYYVFPQLLSEAFCNQIQDFAANVGTVIESNRDQRAPLVPYDRAHPVSRTYKVRERDAVSNGAVQKLIADPVFIAIAEAYLGTHPTIGGVDMWWSALYGNAPGSDAAQLFHFDFDAPPAWLKLFVYITDVGPQNGPHVYVRGTHRAGIAQAREFRARGYERIEDDEIAASFGADALTEITGKRGTVFMADTRGFHKGKMPREGERLLAQLLYCSPLFNDRGVGPLLPQTPEPALAAALAETPRVYDRFRNDTPMMDTLKGQLLLLSRLMLCALRIRPDAIFTVLLGIVSSVLEVMGLAALIPLTRLAAREPFPPQSPWTRFPELIGLQPDAHFYVIVFFSLLLARTITQLVATVLTHNLNRQLNGEFSIRALEGFVRHLSFSQVQKQSIGHFVSVAGEEAVRAAQIVSSVVRLVPYLVLFALYFAMITYQTWQVGLGFVLFSFFILICLLGAFKKSHELGFRSQKQSREAGTHFIETLGGLRTVRSFTAENYVTTRYAQMTRAYKRTLFLIDFINSTAAAVPTLFLSAAMLGAVLVIIPPAQLIVLLPGIVIGIMMVLRLLPLTAQTLDVALRLTSDLKAAESVSEMLDAAQSAEKADKSASASFGGRISQIEFQNIFFRYTTDTPKVLENFSTSFVAGKSYAISGPSGAGKSTIVDILLKFFDIQQGEIRINGISIEDISSTALRKRIVLAEQTVRVFFDTIEHNVQFGREASSHEVARTLGMVGLGEFLASLPDGQRTLLNYQGSNVSGGQRQRIGLARALLLDADVLIMDESTSALDQATRQRILVSILPLYRDRIIIFITHDPAILEMVDEVIHLEQATPVVSTMAAV